MGWKEISNFLKENGRRVYYAPAKVEDPAQREMYETLKAEAQAARDDFNVMCGQAIDRSDYYGFAETHFLNGSNSNIRTYFWARYVDLDHSTAPYGIAVFCENFNGAMQCRVSLDIAYKKANELQRIAHRKVFELPKHEGLVYLIGGGGNSNLKVTDKTGREILSDLNAKLYEKGQPAYMIPIDGMDDDEINRKLREGFDLLIPYYRHIYE